MVGFGEEVEAVAGIREGIVKAVTSMLCLGWGNWKRYGCHSIELFLRLFQGIVEGVEERMVEATVVAKQRFVGYRRLGRVDHLRPKEYDSLLRVYILPSIPPRPPLSRAIFKFSHSPQVFIQQCHELLIPDQVH